MDQETTVRNQVFCLLVSTPLNCTIKQLCYDYRSQIGHEIPYRQLGYNSVEHFLRSMPDKVLVLGCGPQALLKLVPSEKSAHVNALVLSQKFKSMHISCMNRRRAIPQLYYNNFQGQGSSSQNIVYQNHERSSNFSKPTQNHRNYLPKSLPSQRNANVPQVTDRLQEEILRPDSYRYDDVATRHKNYGFNPNQKNNFPFKCDNNQTRALNFVESSNDTTNTSPSGVQCAQEVVTPRERKLEVLVSNTVPSKNNLTISLNLDKKNTCESEASQIDIPKSVQDNLRELISSHPKGIWCAQLLDIYKETFRMNLNYNEYGYRSLIQLCMDLPKVFHYVRPSDGDFKLYDRSKPLPEDAERTFTVASYSVTSALEAPLPNQGVTDNSEMKFFTIIDCLPRDIVVDEVIPRQFIPEGSKEGDYLDIAIAEIFNLSKFWIHLQDNGLDELMDELQSFFGDNNRYVIPKLLIKKGLYCVCKFSEYHRAVILEVFKNEHEIKVLLLDYGIVTKVSMNGIHFLKKQFAKLPFQSIRARLANIYPVHANTTWSIKDTNIFFNLINKKMICARINKILPEEVLDLYLFDLETGQCINDLLVDEGVALCTTQNPSEEK